MTRKGAIVILVIVLFSALVLASCTSEGSHLIIPDLAYVRCMSGTYTDDADPEPDGIGIDVRFYDSKSEQIAFKDVPCNVRFKIYAYPLEEGEERPAWDAEPQVVYEGSFTKDYSYGMGFAVVEESCEVPFDDLAPGRWSLPSVKEVTVETPQQGVFTCESD